MTLTPERIQELQRYSSGQGVSQPFMNQPKPEKSGFLADEADDWGITSLGKSLARNVLSAPVSMAKELVRLPVSLTSTTTKLASDFAGKYLGEDNPFVRGMRETQKDLDFYKTGLNMGTLDKTSENFGGKVGAFAGKALPYFAGSSLASIPARIVADTAIATGQSGDVVEGAKTGLVSSAIESVPLIGKGVKLARGIKDTVKPLTKTGVAGNVAKNMAKGFGTGYVGDVGTGLAGQRGEENTGAGAFVPGVQSAIGTVLGTAKAVKPLKQDLRTLRQNKLASNTDLQTLAVGKAFQGNQEQAPKILNAIKGDFTIDEIKKLKTAKDVSDLATKKINEIQAVKQPALKKSPVIKKLDDLNVKVKLDIGGGKEKEVSVNYVKQGLSQLRTYFQKEAPEKVAIVDEWINKANKNGLTAKDVEDIAVLHGKSISNDAFKADGTLYKGVTKRSVANTRGGLKTTSREMSQNPDVLAKADSRISNLLVVKELAENLDKKVYDFNKSIKEITATDILLHPLRNIAYRIKFAITKLLSDSLSGNKEIKLNAKEIEKRMNGILVDVKTAISSGKAESQIIKDLENIAKKTYTALPFRPETQTLGAKPGISGIDRKATQELTRQIEETSRKNTKLLPPGTKGTVKSETIPLPAKTLNTKQDYTGRPLLKNNSQAGAIRISGVKANNIHPEDASVMKKAIASKKITDLSNKDFTGVEKLAERFDISMDQEWSKIKNQLNDVLQGKRKVKGTLLPGSLKRGATLVNPLTIGAGATAVGAVAIAAENRKKKKLLKNK